MQIGRNLRGVSRETGGECDQNTFSEILKDFISVFLKDRISKNSNVNKFISK